MPNLNIDIQYNYLILDSVIGAGNGELSTQNQLIDKAQAKGRRRKITPAPLNIPTSRLAFGPKEVTVIFMYFRIKNIL